MKNSIELTSSWILTTEHSLSHYGKPVLVHQTTGEGYEPADVYDFPAESGGPQSCGRFVARMGRRLTGDELEAARLFLSRWRGGPQL